MGISIPNTIKIYHIIHVSKLPAILAENCLLSDSEVQKRASVGETIGMKEIKRRRMEELRLTSYPDLYVGSCVPFYFVHVLLCCICSICVITRTSNIVVDKNPFYT